MSVTIPLKSLTNEESLRLLKDLTIKSKIPFGAQEYTKPKRIELYTVTSNNSVNLPMSYSLEKLGLDNKKKEFPKRNFDFTGELRENQVPAKNLALSQLREFNSTTLSLYPSFGKCLAGGTEIIMFDGSLKTVENIKIGDKVCDENFDRTKLFNGFNEVAMICHGRSKLYEIGAVLTGDKFLINSDHILTLMRQDGKVVDITLNNYLAGGFSWKLIWSPVILEDFPITIQDKIDFLSKSEKVDSDWRSLKCEQNDCSKWKRVCLSYGAPHYYKNGSLFYTLSENTSDFFVRAKSEGDFYGFILKNDPHRFLLSSGIVTHNTVLSSSLAARVCGITLVTFTRITLGVQWLKTFKNMTTAEVWLVGEMEKPPFFDVILCLDKRLCKLEIELKSKIKFLIMDEAHLFCTTTQVKNILSFQPKLVMACTATLDSRDDGMQEMIYKICGRHRVEPKNEDKIKFKVVAIKTKVKVEFEYNDNGKINWGACQKKISESAERNEMILKVVKLHKTKIIILTRLVFHCKQLRELLESNNIECSIFCGNMKTYESKRVLLGTINKIGTGFDEPMFCSDYDGIPSNVMILASSIKGHLSLEQCIGRVFRSEDPIVYDMVDGDRISVSHFRSRRKFYEKSGAVLIIKKLW